MSRAAADIAWARTTRSASGRSCSLAAVTQGPVTLRRGYPRWFYTRRVTVYGYLKAHRCAQCTGFVVRGSDLCHRCATRRGNPKRWSATELLDAVAAWEELEGRPPTNDAWRPANNGKPNRWQQEFPRWPPASAARIVFGDWTSMMLAAGHPPYHPKWIASR